MAVTNCRIGKIEKEAIKEAGITKFIFDGNT